MKKRTRIIKNSVTKKQFSTTKLRLIWVVVGMFLLGIIYCAIQISASGAQLANLERQEFLLMSKKSELSMQLVKYTSLKSIEEKADDLDFISPQKTLYIQESEVVAKLP